MALFRKYDPLFPFPLHVRTPRRYAHLYLSCVHAALCHTYVCETRPDDVGQESEISVYTRSIERRVNACDTIIAKLVIRVKLHFLLLYSTTMCTSIQKKF